MVLGHSDLAKAFLLDGRVKEALLEIDKETDEEVRQSTKILIYFSMGNSTRADSLFSNYKETYANNFYSIGHINAYMNRSDECFLWLEKAYKKREQGLEQLLVDPFLTSVRNDPRYLALKKKLAFPE